LNASCATICNISNSCHAATLLQHAATRCSTLQHTATHCNTLHHTGYTAAHSRWNPCLAVPLLQHTATHRNTLQMKFPHSRRARYFRKRSLKYNCACFFYKRSLPQRIRGKIERTPFLFGNGNTSVKKKCHMGWLRLVGSLKL